MRMLLLLQVGPPGVGSEGAVIGFLLCSSHEAQKLRLSRCSTRAADRLRVRTALPAVIFALYRGSGRTTALGAYICCCTNGESSAGATVEWGARAQTVVFPTAVRYLRLLACVPRSPAIMESSGTLSTTRRRAESPLTDNHRPFPIPKVSRSIGCP